MKRILSNHGVITDPRIALFLSGGAGPWFDTGTRRIGNDQVNMFDAEGYSAQKTYRARFE
jgi:hypothetical protein